MPSPIPTIIGPSLILYLNTDPITEAVEALNINARVIAIKF